MKHIIKITRTPFMLISLLALLFIGTLPVAQVFAGGGNPPTCDDPCSGDCSSSTCGECGENENDHNDTSGDCLCDNCGLQSCIPDPDSDWECPKCGDVPGEDRFNELKAQYTSFVNTLLAAGVDPASIPDFSGFMRGIVSSIDPINILTAELYFAEIDIQIQTPGITLELERYYGSETGWRNSFEWNLESYLRDWYGRGIFRLDTYPFANPNYSLTAGSFGISNWDSLSHKPKSGDILLTTGKGLDIEFNEDVQEPSVFKPKALDWSITREAIVSGEVTNAFRFILHQPAGIDYVFDGYTLESIRDEWGNRVDLIYSPTNLLMRHSCGTELLLEHSGDLNKPHKAFVSDNLYVDYKYDVDGNLTNTVRHISGETYEFSYQYDADGLMTNKINPRRDNYQFTHDFQRSSESWWDEGVGWVDVGEYEDNTRTTTLQIGDGWIKHKVEAKWGYDYWSYADSFEEMSDENDYRYSDVTYDYGNGLEKKYRYEAGGGRINQMYGPYTNTTVNTSVGIEYTYSGENITQAKTFDNEVGESFATHKQYDEFNHITAVGVSYNSDTPVWQTYIGYDPIYQLPSSVTNAEGHWTQTIYSKGSPAIQKAYYSGSQSYDTTFGYFTNGLLKTVTNQNSHVTNMEYDSNGYLSWVSGELGPIVSNKYNTFGFVERTEVLAEDGTSSGRIMVCDVSDQGLVNSITDPEGVSTSYLYDKAGNVTNALDRAGRVTDYTYAPTKQLTSTTRYLEKDGASVPVKIAYDLDKIFNSVRISEPRGRYVETYQLDLQDRVTTVTNIEGQVMGMDYGVANFINKITRFDGSAITYSFDQIGRTDSAVYLDVGNQTVATINYDYYVDSEIKSISDDTSSVENGYDWLNRLTASTSTVDSLVSMVNYQYDPVGNITNTSVIIEGTTSVETLYVYDLAERLKSIGTDEAGTFKYCYNTTNGLTASISNTVSGIAQSYAYDLMDRVVNISYSSSNGSVIRSVDYDYDTASMITNKTISDGTVSDVYAYGYDTLDRLVSEKLPGAGNATIYDYDLAGNRMGTGGASDIDDGKGLVFDGVNDYVEYSGVPAAYDIKTMACWVKFDTFNVGFGHMLLSKSTHGKGFEILVYNNQLSVYVMDGTTHFHIDYPVSSLNTDQWYHVAATHAGPNSTVRFYIDGVQVGSGTCAGISDNNGSFRVGNWSYPNQRYFDGAIGDVQLFDRELSATEIAGFTNGSPVATTNIILSCSLAESAGTVAEDSSGNGYDGMLKNFIDRSTYTLGVGNRLASWGENGSALYDQAGNTTNLVFNDETDVNLDWDERYRLVGAEVTTNTITYGYDVLDRKVSRYMAPTSGGTTNIEHYIYDGNQVVADLDGNGDLIRTYVWGAGIDNMLSLTTYGTQTNTYFPLKDHQNTIIALTDDIGSIVETYDYNAWGRVMAVKDALGNSLTDSLVGNRYLYQGREIDWEAGLYYFRARWYNPETGRWLSKDPIGISGGLNLYEFCGSNPVNSIDPLGLRGEVDLNVMDNWADFIRGFLIDMPDGTYNVLGHGNAGEVYQGFKGSSDIYSTAELADMIYDADGFENGSIIMLWSCSTGGEISGPNYAQQLATEMGSIVLAPTQNLKMNPATGSHQVLDGGEWAVFFPCR